MRIIDADLVVSKLQAVLDGKANEKESTAYFAFRTFIDLIDTEPTIDPATLAPRWVSVEERLPEQYESVIVWTQYGERGEAQYDGKHFVWAYDNDYAFATHWQPLPDPPKGKGEKE